MNLPPTVCWFKTVGKIPPIKRLLKDCSFIFRQAFFMAAGSQTLAQYPRRGIL